MKTAHDIIVKPVITERSMGMAHDKRYVFRVLSDATKIDIKNAVEEVFKVKVKSVNTINMPKKKKRISMGRPEGFRSGWKKAIVTLTAESNTIEFFDGMY